MNKNLFFLLFFLPCIFFGQENKYKRLTYKGTNCKGNINERDLLSISVNSSNQLLINYEYSDIQNVKPIVHDFLLKKSDNISEAVIYINSRGERTLDYWLISEIYKQYDKFSIPIDKRRLCYNGNDEDIKKFVFTSSSPPPPPPPQSSTNNKVFDKFELEFEELEDVEEVMIYQNDSLIEQMPVFPCIDISSGGLDGQTISKKTYCGEEGLMKYIQSSIKYPPTAKEYNITGMVFVQFVVDKDGSVTNVKLLRGVDKSLDAEALRVVRSLPKYKPGIKQGQLAKVTYTIPINFKLD